MKCPSCGAENIAGADECESCLEPLWHVESLQPKKGMERRILDGTVADLKPHTVPGLDVSEPLKDAVETMRKAKVGCVLVFDGDALSGILSDRDLVRKVNVRDPLLAKPVKGVMWTDFTCLAETDELAVAFHNMVVSGHLHVPVRRQDGSYGVVSARDMLHYLCR